jgi:FAD/FMN-containing dehydrogenase
MLLGGFGFLSRLHGLSIDNLVEAEVVLADGSIVFVNEKEHSGTLLITSFAFMGGHVLTRKIKISGGVCAVQVRRSALRLATKHVPTQCPSSSQAT